ncbi:SusC/RagA family TonB-linked outer membrane protein [Niabella hirudinis]|uniref:SusC/RagA family TonB-linked outer membrane protein n=1 Tax=Niabella hirudinis TaxID=1285929 RepID=UPI003EB6B542
MRNLKCLPGFISGTRTRVRGYFIATMLLGALPAIRGNTTPAVLLQQTKIAVTGKVTDDKGGALPGVTVQVKGTKTAVVTDESGVFSVSLENGNATLVFSAIGYANHEEPVNGKTDMGTIALQPSKATALDEVVVIGYGTARKQDLTTAVATVNNKDFIQGAVNNPMQLVDGKVAGVTVSQTAVGDPNAGVSLQVRGASSFKAGNGPLVVIDGMPGGDLRNLAQQDIASITVLKDAGAAAIYGARGAGGVILVQTKRGRAGRVTFNYDGYIDHDVVAKKPEILSAQEFLEHKRDKDFGSVTNWYDALIRKNNIGQNHYLSASGGNENTQFRISGNYRTKEGIDVATNRKEYGLRANFLQKALNGKLELGGNFSYRTANEAYTNYGAFKQAIRLNPTIPIMNPDDPAMYNTLQGYDTYNPVQDLLARISGAEQEYTVIDLSAKLHLTKDLNTVVNFTRQGHNMLKQEYWGAKSAGSVLGNYIGEARIQNEKWADYNFEWLANYAKRFNEHDLQAVAGYNYQEFNNYGSWLKNKRFPSDYFQYNNIGQGNWGDGQPINMNDVMSSWRSKEQDISFLGRAMYNYRQTYFVTLSGRYEGNSKFGPSNKWGFFPGVSVGWKLTNEEFLKDNEVFNDLKLRFSYGVTGRNGFDRYVALAKYSPYGQYLSDDNQWIRVFGPGNNENPDLKWERQVSYNLGLDFGILQNKLSGSLDFYYKKGSDLINDYTVPVPPYLHDQMFVNVGTQSSKGVELALNWNAIQTEDFSYNTNLTFSYNRSRMDKFSEGIFKTDQRTLHSLPSPGNPGPAFMLRQGFAIGNFWGYKYAGVDDKGNILVWKGGVPGSEKIDATNNAGEEDKTIIGNGMPKFEAAWGHTFTYKNIDLSLFLRGRYGYQIMNLYQMYYGLQAEPAVNLLKDAYSRNGQIKSGKVITDYFLEDGSYTRLDNLTLGWKKQLQENTVGFNSLRVYGTVRNLFTITQYTGLDPAAVNVTGLEPGIGDFDVYPATRSFTLGLQLNF